MLAVEHLTCTRGRRRLFSDVNFVVHPGACLHLQGSNGAGKTSLLRIACGLARAESGRVLWHGQPIAAAEDFRTQLLYLGHALALKEDLSALENLLLHARTRPAPVTQEAVLQALVSLGLRGREHLPVRVLSQGQKRRAALARLLVSPAAKLWILDEPIVALDPQAQQALCRVMGEHAQAGGMVLFTSHQPLVLDAPVCTSVVLS
jgi:heme exporter protein A